MTAKHPVKKQPVRYYFWRGVALQRNGCHVSRLREHANY